MRREDKRFAIWIKTGDGQEIDIWHYGEDGEHGRKRAETWAAILIDAINRSEQRGPQEPKCWTVAELRAAAAAFAVDQAIDLEVDDLIGGCIPIFLDYLGGAE